MGAQGPTGAQGSTGTAGAPGAPGLLWKGAWAAQSSYAVGDAVAVGGESYIALEANGDNQPPGNKWSLLAARGDLGPVGAPGSTGASGQSGATGSSGPRGYDVVGEAVPAPDVNCPAGGVKYSSVDGDHFVCNGLIGPVGAQGVQGDPGVSGMQGTKGDQGVRGPAGDQGVPGQAVTGATGPTGPMGSAGDTGPAGASGPVGPGNPTGTVIEFCAATCPSGYVAADGSSQSQTDANYSALYAIIGTTFGSTGAGQFTLPDLQGRVAVGAGLGAGLTNRALGSTLGEESHLLDATEMPSHSHSVTDPGHAHALPWGPNAAGGSVAMNQLYNWLSYTAGYTSSTSGVATNISINSAGGGLPHNNMQPGLVLTHCIKL